MTPLLCCLTETLYLYVQSYSLFVCQVAERPLFVERSHTWHNDLIPWGADNISLISHYFVRDNNNEARSGDKARGEMQQWTQALSCLDWSPQSSGNHNLSWWVLNSTNKLTDDRLIGLELLSSTDIPSSPSHHSAALSDCRIDLLQQSAEPQICQPRV